MEEHAVQVTPRNIYPMTRERYGYTVHEYIHNTGACGLSIGHSIRYYSVCIHSIWYPILLVHVKNR